MSRIELPEPDREGAMTVERAIATRASRRSFADRSVTLEEITTVLWAAQGITHTRGDVEMRAAPSAGATHPFVVFVEIASGGCASLEAGLYRYHPGTHELEVAIETPIRSGVSDAALGQPVVANAPATVVLAADYDRTVREYPDHGERYVHMEAGHIAQNVHLICEARELHSCPVGAFVDDQLADVLELSDRLAALYLVPFGGAIGDHTGAGNHR